MTATPRDANATTIATNFEHKERTLERGLIQATSDPDEAIGVDHAAASFRRHRGAPSRNAPVSPDHGSGHGCGAPVAPDKQGVLRQGVLRSAAACLAGLFAAPPRLSLWYTLQAVDSHLPLFAFLTLWR